MWIASFSVVPLAPLLPTRSLPARSTRWSLERRTVLEPCGRASSATVNTQCERDETAFIDVSETARLVSPTKRRLRAASSLPTTCDESPLRRTEPSASSVTPCTRASCARSACARLPCPLDCTAACRESSKSKPVSL